MYPEEVAPATAPAALAAPLGSLEAELEAPGPALVPEIPAVDPDGALPTFSLEPGLRVEEVLVEEGPLGLLGSALALLEDPFGPPALVDDSIRLPLAEAEGLEELKEVEDAFGC